MKNTLQVIQMEKFVRQSLLYDFYGELLTQTQKSIYEDVVMNDLSYSELAREYGISRQGVFDMMKRCDKKLEDFEKKLKLVEKFENAREKVATIQTEIQALRNCSKTAQFRRSGADMQEALNFTAAKLWILSLKTEILNNGWFYDKNTRYRTWRNYRLCYDRQHFA